MRPTSLNIDGHTVVVNVKLPVSVGAPAVCERILRVALFLEPDDADVPNAECHLVDPVPELLGDVELPVHVVAPAVQSFAAVGDDAGIGEGGREWVLVDGGLHVVVERGVGDGRRRQEVVCVANTVLWIGEL